MVYMNGCSFVHQLSSISWGDRGRRSTDIKMCNDGIDGANNQHILRTTLSRNLKDYSYIYIGWSSVYRFEAVMNDGITYNITEEGLDNHWQLPTEQWIYDNFINQVLTLQNYLKYNNIPFFFFLSFDTLHHHFNNELFELIDEDTFLSLYNRDLVYQNYVINKLGKSKAINEYNDEGEIDGHPTKVARRVWLKYLNERRRFKPNW